VKTIPHFCCMTPKLLGASLPFPLFIYILLILPFRACKSTKGEVPLREPRPSLGVKGGATGLPYYLPLQPGDALRRADVDRLLHLDPHHLLARLVERQHRVVVHLELPPVNLGLKHLRPRNHVVPEDDLLRRPPQ